MNQNKNQTKSVLHNKLETKSSATVSVIIQHNLLTSRDTTKTNKLSSTRSEISPKAAYSELSLRCRYKAHSNDSSEIGDAKANLNPRTLKEIISQTD